MVQMGLVLAGTVAWGIGLLAPAPAAADEADGGGAPGPAYAEAQMFQVVEGVPRALLLAQEVDRLIDRVVALNEHHGWRWSETGSLIASLEEAFIDLDGGDFDEAAFQLAAFSDRVSAYVNDGSLAAEVGVPLLDAAGGIRGRVEALGRAGRLEPAVPRSSGGN